MADEHTPTQNDQDEQNDLDIQDKAADDVKGGSLTGRFGHDKGPDGVFHGGAPKKGPETFHGG